jgi:hypothetical protein
MSGQEDFEVKNRLAVRFMKENPIASHIGQIDVDKWRELVCDVIKEAVEDEDSQMLGLLAGWFALLAPRRTLLKFALWLESEEKEPLEDGLTGSTESGSRYKH